MNAEDCECLRMLANACESLRSPACEPALICMFHVRVSVSARVRGWMDARLRDCARGSRRVFARWLVCAYARMRVPAYANECDRGCVYLRIYAATYVLFCLRDLQQRCRCMVACTIDVARHAHAARQHVCMHQ
jgi:hypothetical protein